MKLTNGSGRIEAAVSISGPRAEFDRDGRMDELVGLVLAAAGEISGRLGWTGNGEGQG